MLTRAQQSEYGEVGAIVLPEVLTANEIEELRRVTDAFIDRARSVTTHDAIYDLENGHTPQVPRVRRIKEPHLHHPAYRRLVTHPRFIAILQDVWGPDIRFQTAKLNLKSANFGAAVEWHQDWAFDPHTNDELATIGIMMDDMELENGPLLVVPGTHHGPVFDHHCDGVFCGAMDPTRNELDLTRAVPLTGKAGSISLHHTRLVHGSATNVSSKERRLLLVQFRAADAWPLLGLPDGLAAFDAMMVAGNPNLTPRLKPVPVRMPLPAAGSQGSIYENQRGLKARYFAPAADTA